jgi:hypothetical protein
MIFFSESFLILSLVLFVSVPGYYIGVPDARKCNRAE